MKKIIIILLISVNFFIAQSQSVGIGTTAPNASTQLDITSAGKGLLIPRMTTSGITSISNPAKGLMVYDSVKNQLMVNMGTPAMPNWQNIIANSGWGLNGNSGTNPSSQFIGSTDNKSLKFRINNIVAGELNPDGNVFWGLRSGQANTSGYSNAGFGTDALKLNTTRHNLIAIGDSALYNNGSAAPLDNFDGVFNLAVGSRAMYSNTVGGYNIAVGYQALYSNKYSSSNIAIGNQSLYLNTGGYDNTAIGHMALFSNTTGFQNTAIGLQALYSNSTGRNNVATGIDALYHNTSGAENTATGFATLFSDTSGSYNTAIGNLSLHENTNGSNNTGIGFNALYYNSTGAGNTANGFQSLYGNTTGGTNTASGYKSLYSNKDGYQNVAIGDYSLYDNLSGTANISVGSTSLANNINGNYNTAVGTNSLRSSTNAYYNTAVGYGAGSNYDNGYNNVFLGANVDVNGPGYYNVIAIGQGTICTASSQVTIGNGATNSYRAYANWSNISDGRFKKNVQENVPGLDFIMQLRPITYNLNATGLDAFLHTNNTTSISNQKAANLNSKETEQPSDAAAKAVYNKALQEKETAVCTGFVAQEVEAAAKKTGFNFSGVDAPKDATDVYSLRYAEFVVPLVKAVQEQQVIIEKLTRQAEAASAVQIPAIVEKQQQEINNLKEDNKDLQKQIDELKALIKK